MVRYTVKSISEDHLKVTLEGDLVLGPDASAVRDCLKPLAKKFRALTVDLAGLRRIDSAGVGVLVLAQATADELGNSLRVVNAEGSVREVLLLVKLLPLLGGDTRQPVAV